MWRTPEAIDLEVGGAVDETHWEGPKRRSIVIEIVVVNEWTIVDSSFNRWVQLTGKWFTLSKHQSRDFCKKVEWNVNVIADNAEEWKDDRFYPNNH